MVDPDSLHVKCEIRLFGLFSLAVNDVPAPPLRTKKGQWLLALLVLRAGRATDRTWLAGQLWPDSQEDQALSNLRRALTDLRSSLGDAANRIKAPTPRALAFEPHPVDSVDLLRFQQLISAGDDDSLQQAIDLYSGALLEECDEHWVYQERISTEHQFLSALESLATRRHDAKRYDDAVVLLKRLIVEDTLRETAQRRLMRVYADSGNLSAAVVTYRDFRVALSRELRSQPDAETVALYHEIRALGDNQPATNRPSSSADIAAEKIRPTPGRLPRPLTLLVGRSTEVKSIEAELSQGRLITLLGPGGIGKTRLSIHAAQATAHDFIDGAWFADLSGLSIPEMLPSFIASTLEVPEEPSEPPLDRLVSYLEHKEFLLILDNCEHILSACSELVHTLLTAAPRLKVLATSREPLGIPGERRWIVPTLSTPPADFANQQSGADSDDLLTYDAVRLFVERGKGQRPGFTLTNENAGSIAAICSRLDGIPLAIELAAARLTVLTPSQIESRLTDRFRLLTGGSRTAWPRHQTLIALIDWSFDLLTDAERLLLRRLAVFKGGWTVDDLEAVCCSGLEPADSLDLFSSLVDKSLVQPDIEIDGERRYRLLDTIREFALEKLKTSNEMEDTHRCHAAYFRRMAETANEGLLTVERESWIRRLEREHENLKASLEWATQTPGEMDCAVNTAISLCRFWYAQNHFDEGLRWMERILGSGAVTDKATLCKAYNGIGSFYWAMGDYDAAQHYYALHLEIRRVDNDPLGLGYALQNLGLVAMHRGEYPRARVLMEESIVYVRQYGSRSMLATCLNNLAIVDKDMGDLDPALALMDESYQIHQELRNRAGMASVLMARGNVERRIQKKAEARASMLASLAIYEELGDKQGCGIVLHNLGEMVQLEGDSVAARGYYEESLEISREIVDRRQIATTLGNLGELNRKEGNLDEYRSLYRESADLAIAMKDRMLMLSLLANLIEQAWVAGEYRLVSCMLGSISAAAEQYGLPLSDTIKALILMLTTSVREHLGDPDYNAAWGEGRNIPLEETLKGALAF